MPEKTDSGIVASPGFIRSGTIEPRLYQQVLAASVLEKGSTLLVAPTALGKTIIAALILNQLLVSKPRQKILFLAPTKPLAVQHQATLRHVLDIPEDQIELVTGATPAKKRHQLFEQSVVVSATPQSIENDLINRRFSFAPFSMVVFDECHRAVGDYSYVFLAKEYKKANPNGIVLGLTASPGGTSERISDVCKNLFIENVEIKTLKDADVLEHVNEIHVDWQTVDLPDSFLQIKELLRDFQSEQVVFLKKLGLAKNLSPGMIRRKDLLILQSRIRRELSQNPNKNPSLYSAVSRLAALFKVGHAETLLETQGVAAVADYFEKMKLESNQSGSSKAIRFVMADARVQKAGDLVSKLAKGGVLHPKQSKLLELLENQFKQNSQSRVIVFNHYRDSVRELVRYLNEKSSVVRAVRFVGQATKNENDLGLSQKEQVKTIDRFRSGDFNVLVASSVAEEGLDIPSVDLVVFYEPVPSEIRLIQRRGRTGRWAEGHCVILMAKKTRDEAYYWSSQAKERKMHSTLREMKKNRGELVKIPKQTTLHKYSEKLAEKVVVFADHREQASSVIKKLVELGAMVETKQLEVGDYVLSADVCVERKSVEDFLNSMIDGRLFSQLVSLSDSYRSAFIILEGNIEELYSLRNIHKNAIIGALSAIAIDYRIPVLWSRSPAETAEMLFVIGKREQFGKEKDLRIRTGRKGLTTPQLQQFVIESLPLVGPTMAKSLLKHFKSVRSIMNASEKDLQEVDNMGEKKARRIVKLVNSRFDEKETTGGKKETTESEKGPSEFPSESEEQVPVDPSDASED